jgi:hypothetical protein
VCCPGALWVPGDAARFPCAGNAYLRITGRSLPADHSPRTRAGMQGSLVPTR